MFMDFVLKYRPGVRSMAEVIVAGGLTRRFGKLVALQDLNLKVRSGDCVGLLGPNGAGKSTFIKILCGIMRPTKGRVYVNGLDPFTDRKKALADVGCIVEEPTFYPYFNSVTLLRYFGRTRGMEGRGLEKRIDEVLEITDLKKWSKTKVGKFSRGMRQRLSFAQAILHDPSTLILDEPGLGLDPRAIYEMRQFIKSLASDGKTIFLASHMLYEVQEICRKVALINEGKLLVHEDVSVLEKMFISHILEVEVLQAPNATQLRKIKELEGIESLTTDGTSLKLKFNGDRSARAELLRTLVDEVKLKVASFSAPSATLEEIYLQIVGD